jgi:hypothetical protein
MQPYRNITGSSGVTAYEIGEDFITIEFSDGSVYRYTYASAGQENVERMKGLAEAGQGLNTFISTTVSKLFERKEK